MNTKVKGEIGTVMFSVYVNCPHCGKRLDLNDYPYDDDTSEFFHSEVDRLGHVPGQNQGVRKNTHLGRKDVLGMAVFGSKTIPAQWENIEIEYRCCHCDKPFVLSGLET